MSALREARLTPERVFLAIGLTAGLLSAALTPPFAGADEPAHLRRAYQLAQGDVVAERRGDQVGGFLPPSIRLRRPAEGEPVFVDFRNTAVYAPIAYLPQAVAISAGRAADPSPAALLVLGRLAGLAASLGLAFLAIRLTPIAKRVFVLLALTPMGIRQMSLLSADSVTNGACLLLLALALRGSVSAAAPAPSLASLALCSVCVSLAKIAYFPFAFLYLLIPAQRLGGRRRRALGLAAVAGASALATAAWLWWIRDLYVSQDIAPSADPGRQLAFILEHPFGYARIVLADLYRNGWMYVRHCLGYAGNLPHSLTLPHLIVVALVALADGRADAALALRAKALLVAVFAATYLLVITLNYMGWSPVGSGAIRFVQGRYYIPIAPLPFLLLSNRRLASLLPERRLTSLTLCAAAFFALVAIGALVQRFHAV